MSLVSSQGFGLELTGLREDFQFLSESGVLQGPPDRSDFGFQENEWDQHERKQQCGLHTAVSLLRGRRSANARGRVIDRTACMPWDDELEYTSHKLCLQHADFGHQCSTMLVLRGQLLDASPVGNNCFVRTLVAAASAFTSKFSEFTELEYEAGRERLYQIARAAQTGETRHGYPNSYVDQMVWFTGAGATEDQHIPSDIVVLLYDIAPNLTFGIVTSPYNIETFGAVLSVGFYGARVRDGTLLQGDTLVRDVVWIFVNEGHFQALTLQGNLEVCNCQPTFSLEIGRTHEIIVMDCTILGSGSSWKNSETPAPSPPTPTNAPVAPQMLKKAASALHTSPNLLQTPVKDTIHPPVPYLPPAPAASSSPKLLPSTASHTPPHTFTQQQTFGSSFHKSIPNPSLSLSDHIAHIQLQTGESSAALPTAFDNRPANTPPTTPFTPSHLSNSQPCPSSASLYSTPGSSRFHSNHIAPPDQLYVGSLSSSPSNRFAPTLPTPPPPPPTTLNSPMHIAALQRADMYAYQQSLLGTSLPPSTRTAVIQLRTGKSFSDTTNSNSTTTLPKAPTPMTPPSTAMMQLMSTSAHRDNVHDSHLFASIHKAPIQLQLLSSVPAPPGRSVPSVIGQDALGTSCVFPGGSFRTAQESMAPLRAREKSSMPGLSRHTLAGEIEEMLVRKLRQHQMEHGFEQSQNQRHSEEQYRQWQQQQHEELLQRYRMHVDDRAMYSR